MSSVRRAYLYLIAAVAIVATALAVVSLARTLLAGGGRTPSLAFPLAVVIVAGPFYLLHWRWANRDAASDDSARGGALRALYLYGIVSAFLGPLLSGLHDLLRLAIEAALPGARLRTPAPTDPAADPTTTALRAAVAVAVYAVLLAYHLRLVRRERPGVADPRSADLRRLFVLGWSALGLGLAAAAVWQLVRVIVDGLVPGAVSARLSAPLPSSLSRLLLGALVWSAVWGWWQGLRRDRPPTEGRSALGHLYVYAVVFVAVVGSVTSAGLLLAGAFRGLLGLGPRGSAAGPVASLVVLLPVWWYHARQLAAEGARSERQEAVERLYGYLVAGIGLGVFLIGLEGLVDVVLRGLGVVGASGAPGASVLATGARDALRESLALSLAEVIVGLPVWHLVWRRLQASAEATDAAGERARRSVVRRLYLYFYLAIASIVVLWGTVFIVAHVLSLALGERGRPYLGADLAEAVAVIAIGGLVWLYHGWAVRGDGRLAAAGRSRRLAAMRVTIVEGNGADLVSAVLESLRRALPEIAPVVVSAVGPAAPGRLAESDVVLVPVSVLASSDPARAATARAVATSPGVRIVVPDEVEGWAVAGAEASIPAAARQAAHAVSQVVEDRPITTWQPAWSSPQNVAAAAAGVLLLLVLLPLLVRFLGLPID